MTITPVAAVSVAVFRGEEVLLVQRGQQPLAGVWSLPGGHLEPGEPAAVAALRELAEESGVSAELMGVADVVDVIVRDADGQLLRHYMIAVYAARWIDGEPASGSDSAAACFLLPEAISSLTTTAGLAAVVARARRMLALS
jgi:8-oxo-dGTP diphosphatase